MTETTSTDSARVDAWLDKHGQWRDQLTRLRQIMLATGMQETVKWSNPTYTDKGKNIVSLAAFKNHCAVWFHQGVFLKDQAKKLINAQEGTTRALRQWRLEPGEKINTRLLKSYVLEAIDNQRAGKQLKPAAKTATIPAELQQALQADKKLAAAFSELTPGRQKEYADHIGTAKREATRVSRLEKAIPMIRAGKGLYDRYKNC